MNLPRYLRPEQIQLGLAHGHLDTIDPDRDREDEKERLKAEVIEELSELFEVSGEIRNPTKFRKDFVNREKLGSTAIGGGVALPHVRSMQPRKTVVVFARTREGVWFDPLDGELTHIFFGITAPEYDDRDFYRFHKRISNAFVSEEWLPEALLEAEDEHEVLKILSNLP
jgi:mannitol/fructose-specific phosphotransferase system IIA component (Ntr-type)